jgi:glycerol transport system permease protein
MIERIHNQKAWIMVLPVILLVAFNAVIPLMTVVNYSVQETFGNNVFFWEGLKWYEQVLHSERFHASMTRQIIFNYFYFHHSIDRNSFRNRNCSDYAA